MVPPSPASHRLLTMRRPARPSLAKRREVVRWRACRGVCFGSGAQGLWQRTALRARSSRRPWCGEARAIPFCSLTTGHGRPITHAPHCGIPPPISLFDAIANLTTASLWPDCLVLPLSYPHPLDRRIAADRMHFDCMFRHRTTHTGITPSTFGSAYCPRRP